jgi:DNA-binding beta-propeller fold protein YncE
MTQTFGSNIPGFAAFLLLASLLAGGCASVQPRPKYVWPPAPEQTRIEYVRSLHSQDDANTSLARRILSALLPHDSGSIIKTPTGIALSPDDRYLFVACAASGRIVRIDLKEDRFTSFGAGGRDKRPVVPYGVAVDGAGKVYVTDRTGSAVYVFEPDGRFAKKFGGGRLERPTDIAIDRVAQQVYVVSGATSNEAEHRIEVFSLGGDHVRTIGKRGANDGEFNFPTGMAVGPDGTLYVDDMLNFRVQSFTRDGRFSTSFGRIGVGGPGTFDKIRGVAFDTFGNIYVVDARQGVHILNANRQALLLFGQPPFMTVPGPIAIDGRNHIFIADFGQDGVHEYRLVNTTAADSGAPAAPGPAVKEPETTPAPRQGQ